MSFGEAGDAATFGGDYDVYVLDPITGARTRLFGDAGAAELEAVPVFGRTARGIFESAFDEPNAFTRILPGRPEADVHVLDMPLLASLLFQNTPTGRLIEGDLRSVELLEEMPPPPEVTSYAAGGATATPDGFGQLFVNRPRLGIVPLASDGSAHFRIPGGVPFMTASPTPRSPARASSQPAARDDGLALGEYAHQAFKRESSTRSAATATARSAAGPPTCGASRRPHAGLGHGARSGSEPIDLNVPPDQRNPVEGP